MYVPEDAILSGIAMGDILEAIVYRSLRATLRDAITAPLRTHLGKAGGDADNIDGIAIGRPWYGQHEAYWIAHYDIQRRVGMVSYHPDDRQRLDLWAKLARCAGWWWPGEGFPDPIDAARSIASRCASTTSATSTRRHRNSLAFTLASS